MKVVGVVIVLGLVACDRAPLPVSEAPIAQDTSQVEVEPVAFSAGAGAMAPRWAVGAADPTLSWIEPRGEAGSALRVSTLRGGAWTEAHDVVTSAKFFANWADLPVIAAGLAGRLALWPEKLGEGTYDYGIHLAAEQADGSWRRRGFVHDNITPAEYGFASPVVDADGIVRVFWLDGRAMPGGGAMHLATTTISASGAAATGVLDDRVCECCSTDAAQTSSGPVVVYRDRSENETRDIGLVRWVEGGWGAPQILADDGWVIQGCPVNGPAVDARGDHVVVVWFSAADNKPAVQVSWSSDAGATFSPPRLVAEGQAVLGRVDVGVGDAGTLLTWVETVDGHAVVRGRWLDDGSLRAAFDVASTMASRNGGFPRLLATEAGVLLAHLDSEGQLRVVSATRVPQPRS